MNRTSAQDDATISSLAEHTEESDRRKEQDNAQAKKGIMKALFILLLPIIGGCVAAAMGESFWIGLIAGCIVHHFAWKFKGNPFRQK